MVVHIFGDKDSSCCANYALKKTGRAKFNCYNLPTIEILINSFYVDDFLKSVPSEEPAKQFCLEIIEVMAAGGLKLTKLNSNSPAVLS